MCLTHLCCVHALFVANTRLRPTQALVLAMDRHAAQPEVVQLAVLALTNLLCDLKENVTEMVASGGIPALKKALEAHPSNPRMLEDAMCCLSNLLYAA